MSLLLEQTEPQSPAEGSRMTEIHFTFNAVNSPAEQSQIWSDQTNKKDLNFDSLSSRRPEHEPEDWSEVFSPDGSDVCWFFWVRSELQ